MGTQGISIVVVPKSSRSGVMLEGDTIKVYVHAAPVDGEANQAVRTTLADALGVAKSRITILRGEKGRHKVVAIEGWDEEGLRTWLSQRKPS